MTKRLTMSLFMLFAGVVLLSASASVRAEDKPFPVVTGDHWVNATPAERMAFISGLTTMIELEKEVQGTTPPQDQRSLIPAWVGGLSRFTLKEIVAALDDIYTKKPELKAKPVVEVLWYEVAFPKPDMK